MPKRKSNPCLVASQPTLSSFDAALDLLACETFTRLEALGGKFENAVGIELNDGVVKARWEEAVKRYWVMRSIDELCCGNKVKKEKAPLNGSADMDGEVKMEGEEGRLDAFAQSD
jgi:hypothetical protein